MGGKRTNSANAGVEETRGTDESEDAGGDLDGVAGLGGRRAGSVRAKCDVVRCKHTIGISTNDRTSARVAAFVTVSHARRPARDGNRITGPEKVRGGTL